MGFPKISKIILFLLVVFLSTALPETRAESFLSRKNASAKDNSAKEVKIADKLKTYFDFFSFGDATAKEVAPNKKDALKKYDMEALSEISLMIKENDCNQALSSLENLASSLEENINEDDKARLKEFESYLLIEANFCLDNYDEAIKEAKLYLSRHDHEKRYYKVYYFLVGALFYLEKPLELTSKVTKEFFPALTKSEATNLRTFLIHDALNKNQPLKAFSFLETDQDKLIPGYKELANVIIKKIRKIEYVDEALGRYQNDGLKFPLFLRKLQLMARNGDKQQVADYLKFLREEKKVSQEEWRLLANYMETDFKVDPVKIGVILPFSHKRFGSLARKVMDGLELALKNYSLSDNPIQLILKDSADLDYASNSLPAALKVEARSKLVRKQVRELVEKDRVIAILGPLAKATSLAAGEAAEKYNAPVISFSKTENIGERWGSLFRFQNNKLEEAKVLARYAMDYLDAERFVVFYKPGEKGFNVMKAFEKEVLEKGGQIVGTAKINSEQADLNNIFLSVTGGLRKVSEEYEEELKELRRNLDPIVDFDAIFVPFNLKTLKTTSDFSELFNARNVWLLAGDEINVRENRLLDSVRSLRFTGGFPVSQVTEDLQPFFESYWMLYGYRSPYSPPGDYTIYAYEALEILIKLLSEPGYHSRESLKDGIEGLKDFSVLSGRVSAFKNRELFKELQILRIKNSETVRVF